MSSTRPTGTAARAARQSARGRGVIRWGIGIVLATLAVGVIYAVFARSSSPDGQGRYVVGQPGPGQAAPSFTLAATTGTHVSLTDFQGQNVLLYFQEGLSCQPCWDQITDLEKQADMVKAAGVDQVVSLTTDPVDLIARKTRDMVLSTPVLSDPDLAVSKAYHANEYGMMGTSRDGHTFILVGPDGKIRWRADYGGAPKYTMYVPVQMLLADLKTGAGP